MAYARQRRTRNAPPAADQLATPEPSPASPEILSEPEEQRGQRRSPAWGAPIIYCLLLAGAATHRLSFWGYLWQSVFGAIMLLVAYSTFSPKEFAGEVARHPGTTRMDHFLMLGVPHLVFPVVGWVLVIPMGWNPGMFVPAIPWALLVLMVPVAIFNARRSTKKH